MRVVVAVRLKAVLMQQQVIQSQATRHRLLQIPKVAFLSRIGMEPQRPDARIAVAPITSQNLAIQIVAPLIRTSA